MIAIALLASTSAIAIPSAETGSVTATAASRSGANVLQTSVAARVALLERNAGSPLIQAKLDAGLYPSSFARNGGAGFSDRTGAAIPSTRTLIDVALTLLVLVGLITVQLRRAQDHLQRPIE